MLPNTVSPSFKEDKKNGVKVKKQTPQASQENQTSEQTLAKIIEEKPPKKDVIEFLQNYANELTVKKMA